MNTYTKIKHQKFDVKIQRVMIFHVNRSLFCVIYFQVMHRNVQTSSEGPGDFSFQKSSAPEFDVVGRQSLNLLMRFKTLTGRVSIWWCSGAHPGKQPGRVGLDARSFESGINITSLPFSSAIGIPARIVGYMNKGLQ